MRRKCVQILRVIWNPPNIVPFNYDVLFSAADEDDTESLPGDQSRRNSSPEIDTPPKDFEMSQQTTPDDHAGKTLERSLSQIDSNVLFSKKQKGTIDVWWLFDDGGIVYLFK